MFNNINWADLLDCESMKIMKHIYYILAIVSILLINETSSLLKLQQFDKQTISDLSAYSKETTVLARSDIQCTFQCMIVSCLAVSFDNVSKKCKLYGNKTINSGVNLNDKESENMWLKFNNDYEIKNKVDDSIVVTQTQEVSTATELMDVAYGKPTFSSNTGDSPENAVDGNANSYSSTYASSPYWAVDLENMFLVKRIEILARNQYGEDLHSLDISIGSTLTALQLCAHFTGPATNSEILMFACNHDGRFVHITMPGQTGFLELAEVKVYVPV